jgi:hypothetical protein
VSRLVHVDQLSLAQGPTGATGVTGAQGPTGLTGATGPTGVPGVVAVSVTTGPIIQPTAGAGLSLTPQCPIGTQPISGDFINDFSNQSDTGKVTVTTFAREAGLNRWVVIVRVTGDFSGNLTLTASAICLPTTP